jgi:hypothetical protein
MGRLSSVAFGREGGGISDEFAVMAIFYSEDAWPSIAGLMDRGDGGDGGDHGGL